MKKKGIVAVVVVAAVIGAAFTVSSCKLIKTGQTGIVYTYRDGVQKETLSPGLNFVGPMKKVKEFSTSNEILVMSKDKREGSKGNDSFKVATSDDASIAISFQMSYRYNPDTLVDTYKKFKGMDGDDIIESRVKSVLKSKISEITTNYSMMDIYSGNRSKLNSEDRIIKEKAHGVVLETSCQIVTDEIQKHDVFYHALLDGIRSTICEYGRGCENEAYALAEKITLFLAGE